MYLIEVDAHQVDSNPAPLPLQTSEMLAIFFLTFSLSIQSVSMWTITQSSQVCTLFDTLWFFTFESQPQVKRLSFPCQLRLLTKSVWEVSLKLKNEDFKKKFKNFQNIHWTKLKIRIKIGEIYLFRTLKKNQHFTINLQDNLIINIPSTVN